MGNTKDVAIGGAIGLFIAFLFLGVAENIGLSHPLLWTVIPAFPVLSALGVAVALLLGTKLPVLFQLSKFVLVGALNTFVDLGVLNFLIWFSGIAAGPWFSVFKGISFTVAVLNSYGWNKFWTFKAQEIGEKTKTGTEFFQFLAVSVIGFLVNVGSATVVVNVIGPQFGIGEALWANVGALVATVVAMTWNFLGYKLFVFKK